MRNEFVLAAAVALAASGCATGVRVNVSEAPTAKIAAYHRFSVLTPPPRLDGRRLADDPMLVNSITNKALQATVADAFIRRGYAHDSASPDFRVAYYASERDRLDVTMWNYGYEGRFDGWQARPGYPETVPYAEGTVIIDVIDAQTNDLVWRGRGQARSSTDPKEFQKDLRAVVRSIVRQFPAAAARLAAAH